MGAVLDRLNLAGVGAGVTAADELELVKTHLRIDHTDEDVLLEQFIASAKARADTYLNNPFADGSGAPLAIPIPVAQWVLERVARSYERRAEGLTSVGIGGLSGNTVWGEDEYGLLEQYRLIPGF
jgi:Phage gp6-like head-tail connector protein